MSNFRGRDAPGHFLKLPRGAYHKMSLSEKQGLVRGSEREPALVCPNCSVTTTAADLIAHVRERCEGPQDPPQHSQWITWSEAKAMRVPLANLSLWAASGYVRTRGEVKSRQYLLRDVAFRYAMLARRRKSSFLDRRKRAGFWKR